MDRCAQGQGRIWDPFPAAGLVSKAPVADIMSTVTVTNDRGALAADAGPLIKPHGWVQIGILATLFVALFWDFLYRAFGVTLRDGELVTRGYAWNDANWSHALVVPLISLYFLHQHREELRHARANRLQVPTNDARRVWIAVLSVLFVGAIFFVLRSMGGQLPAALVEAKLHYLLGAAAAVGAAWGGARLVMHAEPVAKATCSFMRIHAGLVLMLLGIALYCLTLGPRAFNNDMIKGYAMIMALGGLVWFVSGWAVAKVALFPVAYLIFAVKISDRVWEAIAFKLQGIAAKASGIAINIFGLLINLEADVRGNTIELWRNGVKLGDGLNVAEACSGLRMLMTFIALGVAVAYLARRPWWARLTIVLLTVPIAILVNVGRVTTLGLIFPFKPEWTKGETHIAIGMLMLIPALGLFSLVGWILNKIVETPEQPEGGGGGS